MMGDVEIDVSGTMVSHENARPTVSSKFQFPVQLLNPSYTLEWFRKRKEFVRPWTVFINTSNFRTPSSLPRLNKRIVKNIEYFQSNYLYVFLGVFAYCLITSPLLLFAMAANLGACYILSLKNAERKLTILGHELTLAQQYGAVALCSMPIFYICGAGAALFWVLGASFTIIALHATFFNIDAVQSDEDRFELLVQPNVI